MSCKKEFPHLVEMQKKHGDRGLVVITVSVDPADDKEKVETANDFLRRSSILRFTRDGLTQIAADVRLLAEREGLTGHAASVSLRLPEA